MHMMRNWHVKRLYRLAKQETEVALCTGGIGLDWGGFGYEAIPESQVAEIIEAFPRLEMKQRFTRAVCRIVETRPATTYDNFAGDFGERFYLRLATLLRKRRTVVKSV